MPSNYEKIVKMAQRDFQISIRYHEHAKELAPVVKENADIYFTLGWMYFLLGKTRDSRLIKQHGIIDNVQDCYDYAIKEYEKAIALNKKEFIAHGNMGIAYLYFDDQNKYKHHRQRAQDAFSQAAVILEENLGLEHDQQTNEDHTHPPKSDVVLKPCSPQDSLSYCLYLTVLKQLNSVKNSASLPQKIDECLAKVKPNDREFLVGLQGDLRAIKESPTLFQDTDLLTSLEKKLEHRISELHDELGHMNSSDSANH